jgi:hypothetical protein
MCIIAVKPKGKTISKEILENCWQRNPDGAGIMYAVNGKIYVSKELHSFEKFYKQFKHIDNSIDTNIVVHFRIATSGGVNERNIHPFKISDEAYFCHNGILDIEVPRESKDNDTRIYNNVILKQLPKDFYNNQAILQLIQMSIGSNNKFVIMDKDGNYHILNEEAGQWDDGIWYSNSSYKPYSYKKSVYTGWSDDWYDDYKYTPKSAKGKDDWDSEIGLRYECDSCGHEHFVADLVYNSYYGVSICKDCDKIYTNVCEDCGIDNDKLVFNSEFNAYLCERCNIQYTHEDVKN